MAQGEPAAPAAAPVKVSFSMPKVSHRRPPLPPKAPSAPDVVEYVTSVDAEVGIVVANPRAVRGARVVPKQEDSWRPERRMKNIMLEADPTKSTDETFEMETMDAGPKPNVTYGLTVMSREEGDVGVVARQMSLRELEDQKLKEDLMNLPDEATLEGYEELPVEEFGEALLRGMGWEKGKPIGRNSKTVIEPIEYVRRQGTLGLGAVPAPPKEVYKKYIKPGESRPKRPDLVNSQGRYSSRPEESRGKSSSENLREDERHLSRSHGHREEKDERYSRRSHGDREEKDERYSRRSHGDREEKDEKYSKRSHRHREEEDERSTKRGHRYSEGDDRERRGHKDRSYRR